MNVDISLLASLSTRARTALSPIRNILAKLTRNPRPHVRNTKRARMTSTAEIASTVHGPRITGEAAKKNLSINS